MCRSQNIEIRRATTKHSLTFCVTLQFKAREQLIWISKCGWGSSARAEHAIIVVHFHTYMIASIKTPGPTFKNPIAVHTDRIDNFIDAPPHWKPSLGYLQKWRWKDLKSKIKMSENWGDAPDWLKGETDQTDSNIQYKFMARDPYEGMFLCFEPFNTRNYCADNWKANLREWRMKPRSKLLQPRSKLLQLRLPEASSPIWCPTCTYEAFQRKVDSKDLSVQSKCVCQLHVNCHVK